MAAIASHFDVGVAQTYIFHDALLLDVDPQSLVLSDLPRNFLHVLHLPFRVSRVWRVSRGRALIAFGLRNRTAQVLVSALC